MVIVMGKRKEDSMGSDSLGESPQKRHKKHKKHKHKKRRDEEDVDDEDDEDVLVDVTDPSPPTIKLKIKIGGQTVESQCVSKLDTSVPGVKKDKPQVPQGQTYIKDDIFKTKKAGDDTSDEEKEWLAALEKGELDESGGVKKSKDPHLMTARQRALLHGKPEEELMELPSGYKNPDGQGPSEMTEEQITRRLQKAKRRKEQADQKAEKDKKQTLERLLKKQQSTRGKGRGKLRKTKAPCFRYINSSDAISISVPVGFQPPFEAQKAKLYKEAVICGIESCGKPKKYCCSKTGVPLCSLECYKQNIALHQRNR